MSAIDELRETMARLRAPDGCPWDREQTHQTLCEPLIDETCELLDTIDRNDMEHMCEELGDVLLQVVFHAQLADERDDFNFDDVARGINEKLVRRHPHVFGDVDLQDTEAVLHQWEQIKASEKKNGPQANGVFKHLPRSLPSLMYAADVAKQIRKKGLEHEQIPDPAGAESMAEDLSEAEVGELLFQIAAACDKAGIDGESALRKFTSNLVREIEGQA
ncbi:MAG: YabN family protein [Puniceicoccaceae bacterium]